MAWTGLSWLRIWTFSGLTLMILQDPYNAGNFLTIWATGDIINTCADILRGSVMLAENGLLQLWRALTHARAALSLSRNRSCWNVWCIAINVHNIKLQISLRSQNAHGLKFAWIRKYSCSVSHLLTAMSRHS